MSGYKIHVKKIIAFISGKLPWVAQMVKCLPTTRETWVRSLTWEDPPGEANGYTFQYLGLENSMDCIVHGFSKSWTRLSDFHFTSLHFTLLPSKSISVIMNYHHLYMLMYEKSKLQLIFVD